MARTVSNAFREAFWAQETDAIPIVLLEVNHDSLSSPLRFALNTEKVRKKPIKSTLAASYSGSESTLDIGSAASSYATSDAVTILLDSGAYHDTTVSSVQSGPARVVIATPLPSAASSGNQFAKYYDHLPFPFEVNLPNDEAGAEQAVKLRIDNIDQTISGTLKSLTTPPTVTIQIVLSDDPDTVEQETPELVWQATDIDQFTVQGTLTGPLVLHTSYPMEDFTPSVFPGLFRSGIGSS